MAYKTDRFIHVGIKGTVFALDRSTGAQVWQTPLKGSDFVNLVLDGGDLFATTRGELFCLDPTSGTIRWNNPMRGSGWGLITIASPGSNSIPPMAEYRRQQDAAAAASSSTTATVG